MRFPLLEALEIMQDQPFQVFCSTELKSYNSSEEDFTVTLNLKMNPGPDFALNTIINLIQICTPPSQSIPTCLGPNSPKIYTHTQFYTPGVILLNSMELVTVCKIKHVCKCLQNLGLILYTYKRYVPHIGFGCIYPFKTSWANVIYDISPFDPQPCKKYYKALKFHNHFPLLLYQFSILKRQS